MTPAEWLFYNNQGATRNKPLDPRLVEAMSFLPEMGLTMNVFSGGQDGIGEGTRRTGSTRHDHGDAADVFFQQGDRRLDWANPEDLPMFEEIVRRASAGGVTGFGAGPGYMQPGSMHVGFGPQAVWGAGGKGANAPDWLRAAAGMPSGAPGQPKLSFGPGVPKGDAGIMDLAGMFAQDPMAPGLSLGTRLGATQYADATEQKKKTELERRRSLAELIRY